MSGLKPKTTLNKTIKLSVSDKTLLLLNTYSKYLKRLTDETLDKLVSINILEDKDFEGWVPNMERRRGVKSGHPCPTVGDCRSCLHLAGYNLLKIVI